MSKRKSYLVCAILIAFIVTGNVLVGDYVERAKAHQE